jgi:tetratricopeptide (TPR) repeat protein
MSDNPTQLLIDHFDNSLQSNGSPEMEQLISHDPATAQEWHVLNLAVDAVRDTALYEQVGDVKLAWLAQQTVAIQPKRGTIRSIYRNTLRVAACIFIITSGAAIFKYTTTSSSSLYNKYYSSYALSTSRGTATQDAMEEAYNSKNWTAVIALFHAAKEKTNQSYFLTGMANLELKKYDEAIDKFQQVIAANVQSGSDYFQDEAEFYLAMSWLGRNDVNEALPILEKIKDNKGHLYHDIVAKMSFTDLRIAQYKSHK